MLAGKAVLPASSLSLRLLIFLFVKRLEKIHQAVGINIPLVLHGTHPLSDELVQESVKHGIVKINQNRNVRLDYHRYIEENCSKAELTCL